MTTRMQRSQQLWALEMPMLLAHNLAKNTRIVFGKWTGQNYRITGGDGPSVLRSTSIGFLEMTPRVQRHCAKLECSSFRYSISSGNARVIYNPAKNSFSSVNRVEVYDDHSRRWALIMFYFHQILFVIQPCTATINCCLKSIYSSARKRTSK